VREDVLKRLHQESIMSKQFWVIGGEYADTSFEQLAVDGGATALGPYPSYDAALDAWRSVAVATRPVAHMRYTIVSDIAR
jgi:hypothetical protein